jgi:hypothetical protein
MKPSKVPCFLPAATQNIKKNIINLQIYSFVPYTVSSINQVSIMT